MLIYRHVATCQCLSSDPPDACRLAGTAADLAKETGLLSGTLYPLLMRLSDQGFLDARWQESEQPGKPPRHMYRLTAAGLALAREQKSGEDEGELYRKRLRLGA
jgi:DNA-binding PadR family transcriptional regulator